MRQFSTVLNQLLHLIPRNEFDRLVREHQGDRYKKRFSAYNLFVAHLFSQIRGKDSLRDIEVGLNQHQSKWSHLGIKKMAKSTLSDANTRIDAQIFEKLFYKFLSKCTDFSSKKKFN